MHLEGRIITGSTFLSRTSLPDIQRNTKILAVCGISDKGIQDGGAGSMNRGGWFLSDFFIFHHSFKGGFDGQEWMLCAKPEQLLGRYGKYLSGDDRVEGARRVVMDNSMLGEVEDMIYVEPKDLLPEFLKSLTRVVAEAERDKRPLLVVVLSHGSEKKDGYAMLMGGDLHPADKDAPHLTMEAFKSAIMAGLGDREALTRGLCVLTSACYSGGWAINPDLNIMTTIAGSVDIDVTTAWPPSGSLNNRSCGSASASGICNILLNMTLEDFAHKDLKTYRALPTYAGFIKIVRDEMRRLDDTRVTDADANKIPPYMQNPMFGAANDEWELEYSHRTGLPLGIMKSRWDLLKIAPPGPRRPDSPEDPASPRTGSAKQSGNPGRSSYSADHRLQPDNLSVHQVSEGERSRSYNEILAMTKEYAQKYLNSNPGIPDDPRNIQIHNRITRLLKHKERMEISTLISTYSILDYRLNVIMHAATVYKNRLGLNNLPDCNEVDVRTWGNKEHHNYMKISALLDTYHLFDDPAEGQGYSYNKGRRYILACVTKSAWSWEDTVNKLQILVNYRDPSGTKGHGLSVVPNTSRMAHTIFHSNREGALHTIEVVRASIRSLRPSIRLRSPSPQKSTSDNLK